MRRPYLLLTALLVLPGGASGAPAKNSPTGGAAVNANSILEKSVAAYAAVKSYVGTTSVRVKAGEGKETTATARITFQRPGKIRIEGKDLSGEGYLIVSDGTTTWRSRAADRKGIQQQESLRMAIAGMTGVAAQAPTVVPGSLMDLPWGNNLRVAAMGASKLEGREKIGGADCYRISSDNAAAKSVFWVDSKTFLLRQLRQGIHKFEFLHSFAVEKLNGPVDNKLFLAPK
jgi:outer membrane lipoprotein-sorting protein